MKCYRQQVVDRHEKAMNDFNQRCQAELGLSAITVSE
jgi:hypothetical protein